MQIGGRSGYFSLHRNTSCRSVKVCSVPIVLLIEATVQVIIPYIPTDSPRLNKLVYEMVLAHFLAHDRNVCQRPISNLSNQLTCGYTGTTSDSESMAKGNL